MSVLDNLKKLAFGQGRRNLEELSERLAELPAGQEIVRTVAARTARSPHDPVRLLADRGRSARTAGLRNARMVASRPAGGKLTTTSHVRLDVADEIRDQSSLSRRDQRWPV
jgi:hypothetical protein